MKFPEVPKTITYFIKTPEAHLFIYIFSKVKRGVGLYTVDTLSIYCYDGSKSVKYCNFILIAQK